MHRSENLGRKTLVWNFQDTLPLPIFFVEIIEHVYLAKFTAQVIFFKSLEWCAVIMILKFQTLYLRGHDIQFEKTYLKLEKYVLSDFELEIRGEKIVQRKAKLFFSFKLLALIRCEERVLSWMTLLQWKLKRLHDSLMSAELFLMFSHLIVIIDTVQSHSRRLWMLVSLKD